MAHRRPPAGRRAGLPAGCAAPRYHYTVSAERVVVDVHAIDNAGASVFVLDVTTADFHSRRPRAIADDTGGSYVKTQVLPNLAMRRVARAIPGYYLLTFERPRLARGRHAMSIRLPGRPKISVLARPDYQD